MIIASWGDYASRYTFGAWGQIIIELIVVASYIAFAIIGVSKSIEVHGIPVASVSDPFAYKMAVTMPWGPMFCAALAGGAIFATKWLYHSVAKAEWNCDRIIWRFIAPVNSAVLATAAGFGISAGIMPFSRSELISEPLRGFFFGFFIGHFSDNVLAASARPASK